VASSDVASLVDRVAIQATVWGENRHERRDQAVRKVYPDGMHNTIAAGVRACLGERVVVRTATLDEPEHGLSGDVLESTDVLIWWGHSAHEEVSDEVVSRVQGRVLRGMGLVVLHSGQGAKVFRQLMGTTCSLRWREANDREVVWTVNPSHPITQGLPEAFVIPGEEMYGEFFDVPQPDELVFISSFTGGEVFRSGCCYTRGWGRVFYFRPGHETYPTYHQSEVRRVIANGVLWTHGAGHIRETTYSADKSPTGWYEQLTGSAQGSAV